jgi:hypothetical protein
MEKIKRYTVDVTKVDGMKSTYFVAALSCGGAEKAVLKNVYNAKYALAEEMTELGHFYPDLISEAVGRELYNRL